MVGGPGRCMQVTVWHNLWLAFCLVGGKGCWSHFHGASNRAERDEQNEGDF